MAKHAFDKFMNKEASGAKKKEALRQDRSISWIIQAAWKIARDEVKRMPPALSSVNNAAAATPAPLADVRSIVRSDA